MTCDVLYELVEREVVALDDLVSDYVGGASGLEDVTLGELCDSSSGIGASAPGKKFIALMPFPNQGASMPKSNARAQIICR